MNGNGATTDSSAGAKSLLSKHHLTVLLERGITEETAIAAGLRSASSREAKITLGFDPRSGGILIPYTHPQKGAIRTFRFRPDNPPLVDGKLAKYLTPRG